MEISASKPNLVILTALAATPGQRDGTFVLTRKFLEGVAEYTKYWPGDISVWVQRTYNKGSNLDYIEIHPNNLPYRLNWLEGTSDSRFYPSLEKADVVLAALVPKHTVLAGLCKDRNIPLVYITEYSITTRRQIVRAGTRNPLLRWRRERWEINIEKHYRQAASTATGLQCNGLPTFLDYRGINSHSLLYFDTRVQSNQLVKEEVFEQRLESMRCGKPLRLGFSGRLIAMKGADHLTLVAHKLQQLGVLFTMDICGAGDLEQKIRKDIQRFGLIDQVQLRGVLDFESELLPFISSNIDLFVCCHRQGDPSCTYLETYSCGVPIIGYMNEALSGLVALSKVGDTDWVTPLDNPVLLAQKIADLATNRASLEKASRNALAFASQHTFEKTFAERVQHLLECYKLNTANNSLRQDHE